MKSIVFAILFVLLSTVSYGQYKENYQSDKRPESSMGDWTDRIFFQPALGLAFGDGGAYVNVGLTVGYRVTEKLSAGMGSNYIYSSNRVETSNSTYDLVSNTWGGNVFARHMLFGPIFAATQYEIMTTKFEWLENRQRDNYGAFLAGGGYVQSYGKASVFIQLLYNFSYDEDRGSRGNGPYASPIVLSAGVMVGF